ncbi:hypothetical protein E2320_013804 [Naja naja]|nr:hypothetical protein E2320_013804 [Naja naja]
MQAGVKVFVGNVPEEASQVELRDLFEAAVPGEVLKVALMKQFAFVHLRDEAAAERAIQKLNGHLLHCHRVVVELSRPRPTHTVKIFVGNVSAACTSGELRVLFQEYGPVVECDIVKAFCHSSDADQTHRWAAVCKDKRQRPPFNPLARVPTRRRGLGREKGGFFGWGDWIGPRLPSGTKDGAQRCGRLSFGCLCSGKEGISAKSEHYAFVHMEKDEDAKTAIEHLNGREIKGKRINVELSNKAHKRGIAGYIGQFGGDEKNKIPTLENLQTRNDGLRSGNLAYSMGNPAYSSLDYDYQQRMNNNTKFDSNGQARQISPSFFRRDRSPLRRSPTRAGYALPMTGQQASYRDQPAASLGMAYRPQPTTGQAAMYRAQPSTMLASAYRAQSSVANTQAAAAASALTSYNTQAYGTQATASQVATYEAQPSTTYAAAAAAYGAQTAASYAASYGAQATALSASYGAQPAANQSALYAAHTLSAQPASYGVQPAVGHAASYGAQASSAMQSAYGTQSAANLAAAYGMQDAAAAAYKTQLSASLPTAYRAPAEAAYAVQQSASAPVAAGYRSQAAAYNGLTQTGQQAASYAGMSQAETAVLHPLYERTRLSPPRGSREDLYRKAAAMNKRYAAFIMLCAAIPRSVQGALCTSRGTQNETPFSNPENRKGLEKTYPAQRALYFEPRSTSKEPEFLSGYVIRYSSDLSDDRRLSDYSDFRRLSDSPHAYRHSPTKAQLDYRRLPEMQSDARYAGAYGDYLRNAQLQLHASYQRRL